MLMMNLLDHQGSSPMLANARKHSFILDGNRSSAFTSYRKRGEPDGRQSNQGSPTTPATSTSTSSSSASTPLTAPNFRSSTWNSRLNQQHQQPQQLSLVHPKGHESDCNFTPSPVEPHPRSLYGDRTASKMFNTLPSDQGSPVFGSPCCCWRKPWHGIGQEWGV